MHEVRRAFTKENDAQLIGLSGTLGAGKDVYGRHLVEQRGFLHISTGDFLRDIARAEGLDLERPTLTELGVRLRKEYNSQGALVIKAIEKWQDESELYPGGLAVSGLRTIGEAREVINQDGKMCFVDAPRPVRYERVVSRQRDSEATQTLAEFTTRDELEINGDPSDVLRPNLSAIKKISHFVVVNVFENESSFCRDLDRRLGYTD